MLPGGLWEPYNLHDPGHVSWVGSVLYRSCTTSQNRLGSRWSRSWSIWSACPMRETFISFCGRYTVIKSKGLGSRWSISWSVWSVRCVKRFYQVACCGRHIIIKSKGFMWTIHRRLLLLWCTYEVRYARIIRVFRPFFLLVLYPGVWYLVPVVFLDHLSCCSSTAVLYLYLVFSSGHN